MCLALPISYLQNLSAYCVCSIANKLSAASESILFVRHWQYVTCRIWVYIVCAALPVRYLQHLSAYCLYVTCKIWVYIVCAATYRKAISLKLGAEYNLLPSILKFWFTNCEKFNFGRSYLLSDSHTNTVICDRFAYPSRWRWKPW